MHESCTDTLRAMRAVRIHADGGPEVLRIDEVPVPEPGPGQALVRMRSAALNHLDVWVRKGLPSVPKPRTLGADGAGIVERVGPHARGVEVGMAVCVNPGISCGRCRYCLAGEQSMCLQFGVLGEHLDGTQADYAVLPASNLAPIPDGLGFDEAAAFPLVFSTAWRMLISKARVHPGEWVLVWGIGGGVASAALELCRVVGARAIVTSSSDAKLEWARERGAEATINHARDDVADAVRTITLGRGADVVIEHVGKDTWGTSIGVLRKGGRLVITGATSGGNPPAGLHRIFWKQLDIHGSTMASDAEFRAVCNLMATGKVRPTVDSVLPLEQVAAAHVRLEAGDQLGKIVLRISE
jgi:NADPH:quinone reductase-like Zn-dependent oxidoreductase